MSGAESPKEPNNGVCLGFTCFPAPKNKAGSKENAFGFFSQSFEYSKSEVSLPLLKCDHRVPTK